MMRFLALAPALLLAACASNQAKPPDAKGAYRVLNAGRWQPTKDDLRGPRAPLPPSQSWSLAQPEPRR